MAASIPTSSPTSQPLFSATAAEFHATDLSGTEHLAPAAEERAQEAVHTFLSLAPISSASYTLKRAPASVTEPTSAEVAVITEEAAISVSSVTPVTPLAPIVLGEGEEHKTRRSSSLSSDGSLVAKRRFLRLVPGFLGKGEGSEEGEGDWSEEVC